MEFILNGRSMSLSAEQVTHRLSGQHPDAIHTYGVDMNGVVYPVKQVFALATGLPKSDFTSDTARRLLERLGFRIVGPKRGRDPQPAAKRAVEPAAPVDPRAWPWEGEVQRVFSEWLTLHGWTVTSSADTATKAHGVDVIAEKGERRLGAEVKGWPSKGYADPRRAEETKRTQPTTQAGHWFSQALMKAVMLLDSHPGYESLVVVPDYPRYRDLALRTSTGRAAAEVHVLFMSLDGAHCETWRP